jgi:hypothetical protein
MSGNFSFAPPPPGTPAGTGTSGLAAEQLVKALRQMPVEELRAQMPELEQILSTVKHQGGGLGGGGGCGSAGGGGLLCDGGAGPPVFGAPSAAPAWLGASSAGIHQAQAANTLQQLSRGMEGVLGGPFLAASSAGPRIGQGLGSAAGARPAEQGVGAAGGRSTEEEEFGATMALLQGSAQRGALARRGWGRRTHATNKVPIVEGAELEAYAARGPLTVMVGRNGEVSQPTRGRGNWRRGVPVSTMGRVKFGKGGFSRTAVVGGGAVGCVAEGAETETEGQKRKRAKRGEGPRANRVRRDPEVEGFKCCYCHDDTRFASREELADHKAKMHEGQKQTKQTMPCPVCALPCKDKHLLAIHMRVHTGERPYQCTKCPAKFRCTSGLNAHLRKHAGLERTFMCFCGETFSSRASAARHQETVIILIIRRKY